MPSDKFTQTGNWAKGDIVGRDKVTKIYPPRRTQLSYLNEKYEQEIKNETEVGEYIKALMHYIETEISDTRGLKEKLEAAQKDDDYIDYAKWLKQAFAKRLVKRDLSLAAQKIFANILGNIKARFIHNIVPEIKNGVDQPELERAIYSEVLKPMYDELETNVLDLTMDELSGMLFFLTGNCHINWD